MREKRLDTSGASACVAKTSSVELPRERGEKEVLTPEEERQAG